MTDPITTFFDDLAERGHEPLLEKAVGSIRFDVVNGKQVERWFVTVDHGDVTVSRRNIGGSCTIRVDRPLLEEIVTGRKNAMAAVLRGAFSFDGDIELLMMFQRVFPGPPRPRARRRAAAPARSRR
ncbi:MAG TPA: SCP2 sterol-binding domain-containing protein [Acidimicrobiia bacterium]|nr:SCP2 sterol-binding domain-containing protein [Acidimicrobiia bacterium]